jgi:hypothetical protein
MTFQYPYPYPLTNIRIRSISVTFSEIISVSVFRIRDVI